MAAAKRLVRLLLNKADEFPEFKPFAEMKATGDGGLDRCTDFKLQGTEAQVWEIQVVGPILKNAERTWHFIRRTEA